MLDVLYFHHIRLAVLGFALLAACTTPPSPPTAFPTPEIPTASRLEPTEDSSPGPVEIAGENPPSIPSATAPPPTNVDPDLLRIPPGTRVTLTSISMSTTEAGWATSGWHVLRTADGGSGWMDVTPPDPILLHPTETLQAETAVLDASQAWVVFTDPAVPPSTLTVWRTADGGSSWVASTPVHPHGFGEFFTIFLRVLDPQRGWLLTDTIAMGTGRNDIYKLFKTVDGGQTWGEVSLIPYVVTDMLVQDTSNGWMSEEKTGPYDRVTPFLRVTHTGGQDWEYIDLPPPAQDPSLFDRFTFCSTYRVLLLREGMVATVVECHQNSLTSEDNASYLYRTQDDGTTWVTSELPLSTRSGSTLLWLDDQTLLQLGRKLYRSMDLGQSWDQIKSVNWDGQFSFANPLIGWAVARSGEDVALVNTVDGGTTWEILEPTVLARE